MTKVCSLLALLVAALTGIAAQQEEITSKPLPIGAEFNLSQNVGAGTFFKRFGQDPYMASNLYAFPYYKYGPFWDGRELKVHAQLHTVFEWMGEKNPFPGKMTDKFSISDLKIRAELKNAVFSNELGLSLAPGLKLEAPVSKSSRDANRIIGLGGFITAAFAKWGFFISYKPIVLGYIYSAPYKTGACSSDSFEEGKISGDVCKVAGRQTMVLLKNYFLIGYESGNHNISLGYRTFHHFLRGKNRGEMPEKVASSGIMEGSLSFLEYAYKLPFATPTSITLGLSSEQGLYDAAGPYRFPFFDFSEPSKNVTEAYVGITVAL